MGSFLGKGSFPLQILGSALRVSGVPYRAPAPIETQVGGCFTRQNAVLLLLCGTMMGFRFTLVCKRQGGKVFRLGTRVRKQTPRARLGMHSCGCVSSQSWKGCEGLLLMTMVRDTQTCPNMLQDIEVEFTTGFY